jgi:hypothetical protein
MALLKFLSNRKERKDILRNLTLWILLKIKYQK